MELDLVDLEAEILKATSSFLVLRLNFSGLRTNSTFEIFEEDFHKSLNIDMAKLMCRYRQELKDYYQIYVFIDEYDARMTEVLKNGSTLKPLIVHHKNSLSRTEAMESSFKQFYIRLKSACDNGIAYVFQTGVTPIVMSEFTSGFNISTDLALREEFWDLYGFKKVRSIFNTGSILYSTRMLTGRIKYVERYKDTSIYIKKLLQFSPDPHTLPSQTTMNLIVNNSLGKPILTESIALTYQPDSSKFSFQIPNNVSKRPVQQYNSIVCSNEETSKQTFLDTLILTLHANIEPEFQVDFNSKYSYGKATNLIKTSMRKRIAIEFDNIKTECIKLNGIHDSWQEATRISLSLMKN
ncbi:5816_t:CDS:2 [Entrophospora sp. SA101]|nr:5816_t:CDS:2 [Entrophospora sp. SA101]